MSVNRKMREFVLQEKTAADMPSGAQKEMWTDVRTVRAAVGKVSELRVTGNVRYGEVSHTGLTYEKDIRKNVNRLVRDGRIYDVLSVNTDSRLTNLILKEVDADV